MRVLEVSVGSSGVRRASYDGGWGSRLGGVSCSSCAFCYQVLGQKGKGWVRDIRTTVRDTAFNHGFRLGIDGDLTGTIDHAVADDGLGVDGQRRRSFVRLHGDSCRHVDL